MSGDDDLTPEEKRSLGACASGPEPPRALEEAVVSRLTERGLIGATRRPAGSWPGRSRPRPELALFAAGLAVGQRRSAPLSAGAALGGRDALRAPPLRRARTRPRSPTREMAARVAEYRDWAIGLRRQGSDITGEKLASREPGSGSVAGARGRSRAARRLLRLLREGPGGRARDLRARVPQSEARQAGRSCAPIEET